MSKSLCKLKKSVSADKFDQLCQADDKRKHECRKCGRVAGKKKLLCKPRKV